MCKSLNVVEKSEKNGNKQPKETSIGHATQTK